MLKIVAYITILITTTFLLSGCSEDNYDGYPTKSDAEYELEEKADRLQQELDEREYELQERQDAIESARDDLDSGEYSDAYDTLDEY